jgi:3-hydroxyisobutyrate dehydrogenase-like beta-hydroxyacid dehydrogenase
VAKLGFLGLGIMGGPMARHLVLGGHDVAVWSNNQKKAKELADSAGALFCATPAEVAQNSECAFLCVGDTAMSRGVILGEKGLVKGAKKGFVIADCSTVSPLESTRMAEELAALGIEFLDAPCTGSKAGAEGGTLTFMIGGKQEVFAHVKPFFEAMGKTLYYCGKSGMGLRAKLTQNLILGNLLQAFNEGLVFKRDFSTNFSVKWLEKDIGLAVDLGSELGVPLLLTGLTQQLYQAAMAKGYGEDDICGSIRVLEELAGCEVSAANEPAGKA